MEKNFYIAGVDEAGRGPLAGPLVVAAMCCKKNATRYLRGIRDSKKLSARQREKWFLWLKKHRDFTFATASLSAQYIDKKGITSTVYELVKRALKKLFRKPRKVLLDGSLKAPDEYSYEVIIKGDEKIPLIAAASIVAKVTRDRAMLRYHKKFPLYRFDLHKGYGTLLHRRLIKKHGPCQLHRKSFCLLAQNE